MVNGTKKTMHNFHNNVFNAPPYKTKDRFVSKTKKVILTLQFLTVE